MKHCKNCTKELKGLHIACGCGSFCSVGCHHAFHNLKERKHKLNDYEYKDNGN